MSNINFATMSYSKRLLPNFMKELLLGNVDFSNSRQFKVMFCFNEDSFLSDTSDVLGINSISFFTPYEIPNNAGGVYQTGGISIPVPEINIPNYVAPVINFGGFSVNITANTPQFKYNFFVIYEVTSGNVLTYYHFGDYFRIATTGDNLLFTGFDISFY